MTRIHPVAGSILLAAALSAPSWELSLLLMLAPMISCTFYVAPALALSQSLALD